jgi:hypothetical protein
MKPRTKGDFFDILRELAELKSVIEQYRKNKSTESSKNIPEEVINPSVKDNSKKLR